MDFPRLLPICDGSEQGYIALLHSLDSLTEHFHGAGDNHRHAFLFLFSRFSVASNPMQSLFSPTRTEWNFWCAMKTRGFM